MRFPILTLALSALTLAAPPPVKKEFTVAFTLGLAKDAQILLGFLVENDTAPYTISLVGSPPNQTAGTPAYFNGTGTSKLALDFDKYYSRTPGFQGIYGASVPDLGSAYGAVGGVSFTDGYQDFNWTLNNGTIGHKLFSAFNAFFACKRNVIGMNVWVLSFGVYNRDSTPPKGCLSTRVTQYFNVPGGASPPKA